ncbi:MAG: adenylate/guanylate cyclase domain-containing protein [Pseudomonadota bacterium]
MQGPLSAGRRLIQGFIICLAGTSLALALHTLGWLDTLENKTWDWRASLLAKPGKATDDIRLILLDQNSLDWAKEENGLTWPWPREVYSAIVNYCQRSGAKALAFDVLFTEPSKYGVEDDETFGAAISTFGRFAASVFLGKSTGNETNWPSSLPLPRFTIIGLNEWLALTKARDIHFPRATIPIPEVAQNAAVLSNVHLNPDPDGIYRRSKAFSLFDNKVLPSLGLGIYLTANPDVRLRIEPDRLTIGNMCVPITKQGDIILRYRGPSGTHKAYSAAAVLQSELRIRMGEEPTIRENNAFKDKYVFFGFSAPGLYDLRPTPVGGVYPGVEIYATMLDNFLSGDFMRKVHPWQFIATVVLLALSSALMASFFHSPAGTIVVSALSFSIPILLSLGLYSKGIWLPLVVQETAVSAVIALTMVVNYATEGRQKRFIKNAFKQYLSPAVVEQLIQHPERLKLGGERRTLSIFFSDLQGFTSLSEDLAPEALTALLNEYLSAMTDVIHEESGTVDKYEGDAIIAFWNAPLTVPDHAVRAVRAALHCQLRLAAMRPSFQERCGKELFMRIGINTGPAVVGNMGSHTRFDYTMLGDAVNLASRLEGINKQFGTYTIISESTLALLGDNEIAARELARVAVVGRKKPVTIYEPMFREEYESRKDALRAFAQALDLFYRGLFAQALEFFSLLQSHDPTAYAYVRECRTLTDSPPKEWEGVWVMTTK